MYAAVTPHGIMHGMVPVIVHPQSLLSQRAQGQLNRLCAAPELQ